MGFVRESIADADQPFVDAILERVRCNHPLKRWTVDRDRKAFLLTLENLTREPGPTIYACVLVLDGALIHITVAFVAKGNSSSGIDLKANAHITWLPSELTERVGEVETLVRAAFEKDLFGTPAELILALQIGVTFPGSPKSIDGTPNRQSRAPSTRTTTAGK